MYYLQTDTSLYEEAILALCVQDLGLWVVEKLAFLCAWKGRLLLYLAQVAQLVASAS